MKRARKTRGKVLIFTGDGKGKTSAAMGTVVRMAGRGKRVLVVQFAKSPGVSGEQRALKKLAPRVVLKALGKGWLDLSARPRRAADVEQVSRAWDAAMRLARSRRWNAVVLDEANFVAAAGFLDPAKVAEFLDARPKGMSVILTGRGKVPSLIARADYVTEMKNIRHPFDAGEPAVDGIDF